jgi:hypothetical protein
MLKLASVLALIVISTNQTSSQSENCAPPERRSAAIRCAREINTMEAAAFGQLRSYQSLEQLPARGLVVEGSLVYRECLVANGIVTGVPHQIGLIDDAALSR